MPRHIHNSQGSAYVAIIGASTLVAVLGMSAIMAARVQLRAGNMNGEMQEARRNARSAIELGKLMIHQDPSWRSTRSAGMWINAQAIGSGTMSLQVSDPNDGTIGNWPTDPVVLKGTGTKGSATQIEQITLVPQTNGYTCLETSAFSGGTFTFSTAILTADRAVGTNAAFVASSSMIDADVEAGGAISGSRYLGSRSSGLTARTLPPSTVFDYYIANGTTITYGSTGGTIQDTLLSPNRNPYGAQTNPLGIYVIDCGNQKLEIKKCRIVGTLVILNCKNDSKIEDSVNIAPAVSNFPSLLVKGSFNLKQKKETVKEPSGKSLNPPGTPYLGVEDNDTVDVYPSEIRGLVYVSGNLYVEESPTLLASLIVNGWTWVSGSLECKYDPTFLANPPPGFCDIPQMKVLAGSSKRVVN